MIGFGFPAHHSLDVEAGRPITVTTPLCRRRGLSINWLGLGESRAATVGSRAHSKAPVFHFLLPTAFSSLGGRLWR
jgi:hypothetical protein